MSYLERLNEALEYLEQCYDKHGNIAIAPIMGSPVVQAARAYRDLLANGQRVWWCEIHDAQQDREDRIRCDWADGRGCRIVSRLLIDYPQGGREGATSRESS